jgi:hypothetical protein
VKRTYLHRQIKIPTSIFGKNIGQKHKSAPARIWPFACAKSKS